MESLGTAHDTLFRYAAAMQGSLRREMDVESPLRRAVKVMPLNFNHDPLASIEIMEACDVPLRILLGGINEITTREIKSIYNELKSTLIERERKLLGTLTDDLYELYELGINNEYEIIVGTGSVDNLQLIAFTNVSLERNLSDEEKEQLRIENKDW